MSLKTMEFLLSSAIKSQDKIKIQKAFEKIYVNYVKLVAFLLGKYFSDSEIIKELTNETFLKFFNNAENVQGSIKYYLMTLAKNLALDFIKKNNKISYIDNIDQMNSPEYFHSSPSYIRLIADLKFRLNEQEVYIIILHVIEGFSFKEIAKKLNISSYNANKIYNRAIKKINKGEI